MNKIVITLRLITVLSFFLPFTFIWVTCNTPIGIEITYNKHDALLNEAAANGDSSLNGSVSDTIAPADINISSPVSIVPLKDTVNIHNAPAATPQEKDDTIRSFFNKLVSAAILPTQSSVSAIGDVFLFKNTVGKILIGIYIIASLIAFCTGLFKKHRLLTLQIISTVSLAAFIADCFITHVDILFGAWFSLLLVVTEIGIGWQSS